MKIDERELEKAIHHLETGDWRSAHEIVQVDDESPFACWAHGIVHLMEGNQSNGRYWFRKAGRPLQEGASIEREISALRSAAIKARTKGSD